jgi:DNA-directed RNA polymerase subunit beta
VKTYEAIVQGQNIPEPGIPESFKVLLKELQSLALDVRVMDEEGKEVELKENVDYNDSEFKYELTGGDKSDFGKAEGFSSGSLSEDGGLEEEETEKVGVTEEEE